MKQLSDHVYMSDDHVLGCVRNDKDKTYVLLSRDDPKPYGTYPTLEEAKQAILHYEHMVKQADGRT